VFLWAIILVLGTAVAACSNATGAPSALGPDVIFHDEFVPGQMGDWEMEGDTLGQTAVIDERLVIDLTEPNILQFATLSNYTFSDFILEVDVRQLRGDLGNSLGVLFRMQDPGQFYRFEVTGDGLYMVERRNADGTWTRFVEDWTETEAINQGRNVTNRLKVEAIGRNFSFYINDVLVQQASDNLYSEGAIALDAGTFVQGDTQAAFDNVVVRRP